MRGTRTSAKETDAVSAAETTGAVAEERRLNLLRQISLAGGTVSMCVRSVLVADGRT